MHRNDSVCPCIDNEQTSPKCSPPHVSYDRIVRRTEEIHFESVRNEVGMWCSDVVSAKGGGEGELRSLILMSVNSHKGFVHPP